MMFGIEFRHPWKALGSIFKQSQSFDVCKDAEEALNFAAVAMKQQYDRRHLPLSLKPGDKAYLRLHAGYTIPSAKVNCRKYTEQRVGPFTVLERIGTLAYKMDFPPTWRIHNVVSIAQLEPAPTTDPYGRQRPHRPAVNDERFPGEEDRYEVEQILDKCERRHGKGFRVEYLVR